MGCSITWRASWKCRLAASNASRTRGFVSQHFPSYLRDLQNMLNKLWASLLLALAGNVGGRETAALYPVPPYVGHAWGSPVQSWRIPCHPSPEGPVTHLSELWHLFFKFLNYYYYKGQKHFSQPLSDFWLTWRLWEEWVQLFLVSYPSAPRQRSCSSLLSGWTFGRYLSLNFI